MGCQSRSWLTKFEITSWSLSSVNQNRYNAINGKFVYLLALNVNNRRLDSRIISISLAGSASFSLSGFVIFLNCLYNSAKVEVCYPKILWIVHKNIYCYVRNSINVNDIQKLHDSHFSSHHIAIG